MSETLQVKLAKGGLENVRCDGTKVVDGVLYAMRAPYNGGIREMVQAWPMERVESWRWIG